MFARNIAVAYCKHIIEKAHDFPKTFKALILFVRIAAWRLLTYNDTERLAKNCTGWNYHRPQLNGSTVKREKMQTMGEIIKIVKIGFTINTNETLRL